MENLPKAISLDADDKAALDRLAEKTQAVDATFQQFAIAGERRMSELQQEGKAIWTALGAKYGFDPQRVQYQIEGDKLVPKAVRL
jgi:hypothetical protein